MPNNFAVKRVNIATNKPLIDIKVELVLAISLNDIKIRMRIIKQFSLSLYIKPFSTIIHSELSSANLFFLFVVKQASLVQTKEKIT